MDFQRNPANNQENVKINKNLDYLFQNQDYLLISKMQHPH